MPESAATPPLPDTITTDRTAGNTGASVLSAARPDCDAVETGHGAAEAAGAPADGAPGSAAPSAVAGVTVQLRINVKDDSSTGTEPRTSEDEPADGSGAAKPAAVTGAAVRLLVDTTSGAADDRRADAPTPPKSAGTPGATISLRIDGKAGGQARPAEPSPDPSREPSPEPAPVVPAPVPPPPAEAPQVAVPVPADEPAASGRPPRRTTRRVAIAATCAVLALGAGAAFQLVRPLPAATAVLTLPGSVEFPGAKPVVDWPAQGQSAAAVIGVGSLGTSGEQTPVPIASVTKVMNANLILKAHPLKPGENGPMLTVDRAGTRYAGDESHAQLVEGQQISQRQALELLMLPSANNVARLLARWDAGSEQAFVAKMNTEAKRLGMNGTTYADPAGYDNNTVSTAADQLRLAEEVMKDDTFREIVAEPSTRFGGELVTNTNHLVASEAGTVIGVKTGSSSAAQSALMWAAVKDVAGTRRTIIGVTLRQPFVRTMQDALAAQPPSLKIINSIRTGLTERTVVTKGQVIGRVDDGLGSTAPLVADRDVTVAGWPGLTAAVSLNTSGIPHGGRAGTRVGTLTVISGTTRVEVPVTLRHGLTAPSVSTRLLRKP